MALEDVVLSNGFRIKKNTKIVIDNMHMWDSEHYSDPDQFDGYRFLRMRDSSGEEQHAAHLVSTSESHMGFGHGLHACPGRFFAANEIKIALCHLLLKYEWKLQEGVKPQDIVMGMTYMSDPNVKFLIRRRKEELKLESLDC